MCPHCGQNAPLIYRGVAASCSACGRPRVPLTTQSLSFAGKPSRVGGTVAGVIGWIVLVVGLVVALFLGSVFGAIFTTGLGLAIGIPVGLMAIAVSMALLFSGKQLKKSGEVTQKDMRRRAVLALATNRGGVVTAREAAAALDVPAAEADAFLTDLAKTEPEEVTLELDDKGGIYYAFPRLMQAQPRTRIAADDPRVRVSGASGVPDSFESEGLDDDDSVQEKHRRRR